MGSGNRKEKRWGAQEWSKRREFTVEERANERGGREGKGKGKGLNRREGGKGELNCIKRREEGKRGKR